MKRAHFVKISLKSLDNFTYILTIFCDKMNFFALKSVHLCKLEYFEEYLIVGNFIYCVSNILVKFFCDIVCV